jgi:hypothetical protein
MAKFRPTWPHCLLEGGMFSPLLRISLDVNRVNQSIIADEVKPMYNNVLISEHRWKKRTYAEYWIFRLTKLPI